MDEGETYRLAATVSPLPHPPEKMLSKTYQHPHYIRPQLGKAVGRSAAVCPGLAGRRRGPLLALHGVGVICVLVRKFEFQTRGQGPRSPAVSTLSVPRLLLDKVALDAPVKCGSVAWHDPKLGA